MKPRKLAMQLKIKPFELKCAMLKMHFDNQGRLAKAAGLSSTTVSNTLNAGMASLKTIRKIAAALKVDIEEIVEKDDE